MNYKVQKRQKWHIPCEEIGSQEANLKVLHFSGHHLHLFCSNARFRLLTWSKASYFKLLEIFVRGPWIKAQIKGIKHVLDSPFIENVIIGLAYYLEKDHAPLIYGFKINPVRRYLLIFNSVNFSIKWDSLWAHIWAQSEK